MEKMNFCKLVTDIIYEGRDEWWSIDKIVAKSIGMEYGEYEEKRDSKVILGTELMCEHIKTFIPHVYTNVRENLDSMLLSELIDGKRCYKYATIGDEPYIHKMLNKNKKINKRANYRFHKMIENIKQNNLLPRKEIPRIA